MRERERKDKRWRDKYGDRVDDATLIKIMTLDAGHQRTIVPQGSILGPHKLHDILN